MTTDTLRRLQALRGLTRTGSAYTVLAQVQGDLQAVIEAVLKLADENTPPTSTASDTPRPGGRIEATMDGHRGVLVWAHHPGCIVPGWVWEDRPDCCVADRDVHAHRVLPPQAPATAPEGDAQPEEVSEDPETENGPENAAQGRIGWLRLHPGAERRYLMREVPGGWADTDDDDLAWPAKNWPDAVFTPIRTLADDEVAVKRDAINEVMLSMEWARFEAMEEGDTDTEATLQRIIDALTAALGAGR